MSSSHNIGAVNMAHKVKIAPRLDLDHELGLDHFQTWLSQVRVAFELHSVTDGREKYLAAAASLSDGAAYYLWQRFADVPADEHFKNMEEHYEQYFVGSRGKASRLTELFVISHVRHSNNHVIKFHMHDYYPPVYFSILCNVPSSILIRFPDFVHVS